ncbi:MAG: hypothetical protein WED09_00355 [Homoserinimonas sp.]
MTGNEPGRTGEDAHGDAAVEVNPHGSMIAAEDAAAEESRDNRARRAETGDKRAQAEQADGGLSRANAADREKPRRLWYAAEWLDGRLVPKLGGAELGPYEEESEESTRAHDVCPLCGHPMAEHTIDRSTASAVLNCPVPQKPAPQSFEPLNEVGMVKHDTADHDTADHHTDDRG